MDGSAAFIVWNPADNSSTIYETPFTASFGGLPATIVCGGLENIAGFTRSADRKKIILGSADSDSTLCSVDASTGADKFATVSNFPVRVSVSPDGKYIAIPQFNSGNGGSLALFDANTLNVLAQFPVSGKLIGPLDYLQCRFQHGFCYFPEHCLRLQRQHASADRLVA